MEKTLRRHINERETAEDLEKNDPKSRILSR